MEIIFLSTIAMALFAIVAGLWWCLKLGLEGSIYLWKRWRWRKLQHAFRDVEMAVELGMERTILQPEVERRLKKGRREWRDIPRHKHQNSIDAIRAYDEAIPLDPLDGNAYHKRGDVHAESGRNREAIKNYDAAILLNPQLAQAYVGRALAHIRSLHIEQARQDMEMAAELGVDRSSLENKAKEEANRAIARARHGDAAYAYQDVGRPVDPYFPFR